MKFAVLSACVGAIILAAGPAAAAPVTAAVGPGVVNRDAYPARRVEFPGGVVGLPDLTYSGNSGFRPLKLDLYLPPASFSAKGPRPVVVYMHGGGWAGGTPRTTGAFENWPAVLASLAEKGYVVASLSYRLSGEQPFPAAIQDIKAGIRWLRANASAYNIDKGRFMTWGPSAGGQLAGLAAVSCGVTALLPAAPRAPQAARPVESAGSPPPPESECVQGGVGWYGIYDFALMAATAPPLAAGAPPRAENPYLGCTGPCTPAQIAAASATTYVDPKDPPILLIHGDDDHTANVAQSRSFYAALTKAGVKTQLIILPGIEHSWLGKTPEATRAASVEALQKTFDFIDATIGDR